MQSGSSSEETTGATADGAAAAAAAAASVQSLSLQDEQERLMQDDEMLGFPDNECRLVLVGKTGNGKSATANTILGLDARFEASFRFDSTTKQCQRHNAIRFGIPVEVVDTPGLFDTKVDKKTLIDEIAKCLGIIAPGPHAILLVLRIGVRFTDEESKAVAEVHKLFGEQFLRFLVIVFTHGDELNDCKEGEREDVLKGMLDMAPKELKALLTDADHRFVVFDNTASADNKLVQVKRLMTTIEQLLKRNKGQCYTNDLLKKIDDCMAKREEGLMKEMRQPGTKGGFQAFFFRDMAREEVVQGKSLLERIKKLILPHLQTILQALLEKVFARMLQSKK